MTDELDQTLHLLIVTPEDILVNTQALWVQVPAADGMLGIWPGHDVLISSVERGEVSYATAEGEYTFPVVDGTLCVGHGNCGILISELDQENTEWSELQDDRLDDLEEQLEKLHVFDVDEDEKE